MYIKHVYVKLFVDSMAIQNPEVLRAKGFLPQSRVDNPCIHNNMCLVVAQPTFNVIDNSIQMTDTEAKK